jgi:hypothetical protein
MNAMYHAISTTFPRRSIFSIENCLARVNTNCEVLVRNKE